METVYAGTVRSSSVLKHGESAIGKIEAAATSDNWRPERPKLAGPPAVPCGLQMADPCVSSPLAS